MWVFLAILGGFACFMGALSPKTLTDALFFSGSALVGHWLFGEGA
jgi:hypothetical protein